MPSLADTLGLRSIAGFEAARQSNDRRALNQLQQLGGVMSLQQALQKQAQEQEFRSGLNALGPNPSQEALTGLASRFASPADVLKTQQSSLDRKEAAKDRALQFMMTLDTRQQDLDRKREEFNQRTTDTNARMAFEQWYKTESLKNTQAQNNIANQMRLMGIDIQRQGQQLQIGKLEQMQAQQGNKNVQALGTALERANLPEADAVLRGVEDALNKTPVLAEYLSGPKSALPDITPGLPAGVREGRQAFQKLFNITLKNRSGAAVTIPEFERLKQEFATGVWKTGDQLKEGVRQARDIVSKHYKSVAAGYGPQALEAYNENLRQSGGTPILEATSAPRNTPQSRSGVIDYGSLK